MIAETQNPPICNRTRMGQEDEFLSKSNGGNTWEDKTVGLRARDINQPWRVLSLVLERLGLRCFNC